MLKSKVPAVPKNKEILMKKSCDITALGFFILLSNKTATNQMIGHFLTCLLWVAFTKH